MKPFDSCPFEGLSFPVKDAPVIQAVCRDGVLAHVQRVNYEGAGGGACFFGVRMCKDTPVFDRDGFRNQGGDLWNLGGFWTYDSTPHPFDLVSTKVPVTAHSDAVPS